MHYRKTLIGVGVGAVCAAGAALAPQANAAVSLSCSYDPVTKQATATFPNTLSPARTLVRNGAQIRFKDTTTGISINCPGPGAEATVFNTDKIVVRAATGTAAGFQQLLVDESKGAFAPGATAEPGLSEIEIVMLTGSGNDALDINGTEFNDSIRVGMGSGLGSLGTTVDLNGDGDLDLSATLAGHLEIDGKGGDDKLSARGVPGVSTPSIRSVGLHGGNGNDELKASNVTGSLNPFDVLIGDAGVDFLDLRDGNADVGVGGSEFDVAAVDFGKDTTSQVESLQ